MIRYTDAQKNKARAMRIAGHSAREISAKTGIPLRNIERLMVVFGLTKPRAPSARKKIEGTPLPVITWRRQDEPVDPLRCFHPISWSAIELPCQAELKA